MNGFPSQGPYIPPQFNQVPAPPSPASVVAPQPSVAGPVIRAQSGDDSGSHPVANKPAPLQMPSPEQMGLKAVSPSDLEHADWIDAHRRLDRIGAQSFFVERLAGGGCHFCCVLPSKDAEHIHRIEVRAATEDEAVRLALAEAEAWTAKH
jgi:hypothetical protein